MDTTNFNHRHEYEKHCCLHLRFNDLQLNKKWVYDETRVQTSEPLNRTICLRSQVSCKNPNLYILFELHVEQLWLLIGSKILFFIYFLFPL